MNLLFVSLIVASCLTIVGCDQFTAQSRKTDNELGEDIELTQQAYDHAFSNSNDADVIRKAKSQRDAAFAAFRERTNELLARKTDASHDANGELKRAKDDLRNQTQSLLFTMQAPNYPAANKQILIHNQIAAAQKVEKLESN
jgi:hypothetical protein